MKSLRNTSKVISSELRSILIGAGLSLLVSVLLTAIAAWVVGKGIVGQDNMSLLSILVVFLSAFIGSGVCAITLENKVLIWSGVSSALFLAGLLGINILFYDGQISGLIWKMIAVSVATVVSAVLKLIAFHGGGSRKFRIK